MAEKTYANGIYGRSPSERAPDFIVGNISIKPADFAAWLDEQLADEKGYVKLSVSRQKNAPEKWSFSLDTWKPKQDAEKDPF